MQKYVCVATCPELDNNNIEHCVDTLAGIYDRCDVHIDYCPCGNTLVWEPLDKCLSYGTTKCQQYKNLAVGNFVVCEGCSVRINK